MAGPSWFVPSNRDSARSITRSPDPPAQQRRRDRQAERLRGLEVDDQLELGRLLDWEIAGLGTL
jgi:hypothetical protein